MKQKISITIDEETVLKIQERVATGVFRNKSHAIEYAVQQLLREAEDE